MKRRELGVTFENIDSVFRMCGGRATYNKRRKMIAERRRLQLAILLRELDIFQRGWKAEAARRLGVHRGTITRDYRILISNYYRVDKESR